MKTEGQLHLLRVFVNESDRWEGRPLYETIVRAAREQGLAGATALRGIEGFGAAGKIHSVKVLHLSEDVPIVVEIIDRPERIAAFLPTLDKMVAEGVVTIEKVQSLVYRRGPTVAEPQFDDEIPLEMAAPTLGPSTESMPIFAESTERAREIIDAAKDSAVRSRRVYIDSIDVLLAMLCETKGIAGRALSNLGIDCQIVERLFREEVSRDETSDTFLTSLEAKSTAAAKWLGDDAVGAEHLLLALCEIRPTAATDILMRLGAQPRDICQQVLNILGHEEDWQGWLADHPDM